MNKSNMPTYTQDPAMIVPLVRCTGLPMFEGTGDGMQTSKLALVHAHPARSFPMRRRKVKVFKDDRMPGIPSLL
jgi:hypothetical protein